MLNSTKKAKVIANAGKGVVTIATNMAGRGTDIVLGVKRTTKNGNPTIRQS